MRREKLRWAGQHFRVGVTEGGPHTPAWNPDFSSLLCDPGGTKVTQASSWRWERFINLKISELLLKQKGPQKGVADGMRAGGSPSGFALFISAFKAFAIF